MICYISHPIKGRTEAEKVQCESDAKIWCMDRGMDALLPRTIPPGCTSEDPCEPDDSAGEGSPHTHACYMRADLIAMLMYADSVLMMPGWEKSVGARAELNTAVVAGIPVHFYKEAA